MSDFLLNLARRSAGDTFAATRPASATMSGTWDEPIRLEETVPEVSGVPAESGSDAAISIPIPQSAAPLPASVGSISPQGVRRDQPVPDAPASPPASADILSPTGSPATFVQPLRPVQQPTFPPRAEPLPLPETGLERASASSFSEAAQDEPIGAVAPVDEPEGSPPVRPQPTVSPAAPAALRPRSEMRQPFAQDAAAAPVPPPPPQPVGPRIEVRIGRIDVEIASPPAAPASAAALHPPAAPARERPRGFDAYARLRAYGER